MTSEPLWLEEARAEVIRAARWYAEREPGIVSTFFAAVEHAHDAVAEAPWSWRAGPHGTRR